MATLSHLYNINEYLRRVFNSIVSPCIVLHHVLQKHANNFSDWCVFFQVRNLCYMVTRRERIKHSLCNLQEKIFALQIQLLEKDLDGGMETLHNSLLCFPFDILICRF